MHEREVNRVQMVIREFGAEVCGVLPDAEACKTWLRNFHDGLVYGIKGRSEFADKLRDEAECFIATKSRAGRLGGLAKAKNSSGDPCPGKSADIPNAQQSRKAAVPGTPAEGEVSSSSRSAKGRGDIPGIGEFKNVRITAEERRKLERDFGDVSGLIEEMSSYKAAKGKAYKNDCAALRNWAKRRLDEGRSIDGKKMSQQERMRLYFEQKAVEIRQRETAGGMDELV